jgi:hypothetical protein
MHHVRTGAVLAAALCLLTIVSLRAQTATDPAPPMSDAVFKNIQLLKGIPVDEFMDTMGMFSASLGYDCVSCHSDQIYTDRNAFAIATPQIQRARQMIVMMNTINRNFFGTQPRVSCFTCHRAQYRPEVVPSLALQYGEVIDDPGAMRIFPDPRGSVDAVFDTYLQALGGAPRLAAVTTIVARGTYEGFNTGGNQFPVEIYARAPNQRVQVVRTAEGDAVKTYDGRTAWAAEGWRPLPLLPLTGGNLDTARLEALVWFPAGLRRAFSQWQVASTLIDDRPVQILQGANDGQLPVNFYFDDAGLLMRTIRWNRTAVGTVPTQMDFSDYRDAAGVKVPFTIVLTWTDGQNTFQFTDVQPNAAIDAARFARPAPFTRR